MYKITIKGLAGDTQPEDIRRKEFTKAQCGDSFCEYFRDSLSNLDIHGGYMSFIWDDKEHELYTITVYTSKNELTKEQLDDLANYTQGQWSDGIGEGYEQFDCHIRNDEECFISPWYHGQKLEIIQEVMS